VTGPTQAQLDEFARRLRALEAEFAAMQQQARAEPERIPAALQVAAERLDAGQVRQAVRELERRRKTALHARSIHELEQILELARAAAEQKSGAARRLVYAIEQNIRFLQRTRPEAAPAMPPPPEMPPAPVLPPPPEVLRETPTVRQPPPKPQPPAQPPAPREPLFTLPRLPKLEPSDLLGARALAVAGGVVTLLGIVFFFVLAVNRGWVGPVGRVGLGGAAALCVFAGGLELRRRYGDTYSSLAAVGTGIAGGYATLLSAAALYDLLPDYAALGVASAIASVGVATSIFWRSQLVAGFGLIGAMLVPVAVVAQGGLSTLGTAFVAVVLAATAVVSVRLRWRELLVAGVVASVPQIVALVFQAEYDAQSPWRIVLLAAVFSVLYVCAGVAVHLRDGSSDLGALTSSLTFGGGVLAAVSTVRLYDTPREQGFALLVVALVYGLGALFFARRATRDLSALLASVGFTLGAFAVAELLDGRPLAYAWAAEAAAVAWLARRARDLRFQVWAGIYLVLTGAHVLILDAPPNRLFVASAHPASGALTAVALAAAACVFAFYARPWPEPLSRSGGIYKIFAGFFALVHAQQHVLRSAALWGAGIFATYAASLGALALFDSFDWGWVAVTGIWSVAGLAVVVASLRRESVQLREGGLMWLASVGATVVLMCIYSLAEAPRSWALLVLAAVLFVAGAAYQLLDVRPKPQGMDVSLYLATAAIVIAAFAAAGLLGGQPLAYAWAAEAAALAYTARRLRAPHLQALTLVPLGLSLIHVLALDAPPRQLLDDVSHPARGALTALAFALAAGVGAAHAWGWRDTRPYAALEPAMSPLVRNQRLFRSASLWVAGVAGTYTLSLGTLALFSGFDWGWVALAGIWCVLGLGALIAGLDVPSMQLRRGGIAWLASATVLVTAQGFASLAQTPRATAFLVLAAALLVGGLAYALRVRGVPLEPIAVAATLVSLALSWYAISAPLHGRREGGALLALALLYGAIAAALFVRTRLRDLTTLYWGIALVLGAFADALLLDGTYAVLGWAAAGAALAWLSARAREQRFLIGAAAYLALALGHAVGFEAPPSDLFVARSHPGAGAPAILIVAVALAALAYFTSIRPGRRAASWLTGVLALYGLSLSILELAMATFSEGLETEFQRGHTAVSAFWGLLGLALLYAGLKRWRSLRLAGLALFAVSLGKLFLYDLPSLSSVTRALSFLAVGAVLLLGGFFYQRLSSGDETPAEPGGATS